MFVWIDIKVRTLGGVKAQVAPKNGVSCWGVWVDLVLSVQFPVRLVLSSQTVSSVSRKVQNRLRMQIYLPSDLSVQEPVAPAEQGVKRRTNEIYNPLVSIAEFLIKKKRDLLLVWKLS